jgi:hypothetical protein
MKVLVIYHGGCTDGYTAAWAVWAAHRAGKLGRVDLEFHPGFYQRPPPPVEDRAVMLVDFSYKRPVLIDIARRSYGVLVLDHHVSAEADLKTDMKTVYDWGAFTWDEFMTQVEEDRALNTGGVAATVFDNERSGAGLTWDYLNPGVERPRLVDHVEDRDLWKFQMPFTREIHEALGSYPQTFEGWTELAKRVQFNTTRSALIEEGVVIKRRHDRYIEQLRAQVTRPMRIGDHVVPCANVPWFFASDLGHVLWASTLDGAPMPTAENVGDPMYEQPFAATYYDSPTHREFSLRSGPNGLDVSQVAARYGGGGHKHSAGFRVPLLETMQFEVPPLPAP